MKFFLKSHDKSGCTGGKDIGLICQVDGMT